MISAEYKEEFGDRFKALVENLVKRGAAGSNNDIADMLGVKSQALSQMLHHGRMPTMEQVYKLSEATRFNPNWLISGEEPMYLKDDEETDIIVMITKSMGTGLIDQSKGEEIIQYIRRLQTEAVAREKEIKQLILKKS